MRDFGSNSRGPRRQGGFSRGRPSFGPREMHKAVCSECGQECEVPFKPAEGRPVFCKDCFMKKKGGDSRSERPRSHENASSESSGESFDEQPEEKSEDSEDF